jgi:hypothetical protein
MRFLRRLKGDRISRILENLSLLMSLYVQKPFSHDTEINQLYDSQLPLAVTHGWTVKLDTRRIIEV